MASGSDDFTLFLWDPEESKKPLARMTGQLNVNTHCIHMYSNFEDQNSIQKCYNESRPLLIPVLRANLQSMVKMAYRYIL